MNAYDEEAEINFSVGRRFLNGNGVEKDIAKAKELLSQAAAMGHTMAQQLLDTIKDEPTQKSDEQIEEKDPLTEMLEYNQRFVAEKRYKQYATSKYPDRKIAIVTCMDTRLVQLLPAALGIKNGDVKIIKNAGGTITNPFDSTVRSLLVAIYELGVNEVMIIGHTTCGVQGMDSQEMLHLMRRQQ